MILPALLGGAAGGLRAGPTSRRRTNDHSGGHAPFPERTEVRTPSPWKTQMVSKSASVLKAVPLNDLQQKKEDSPLNGMLR